MLPALGPYRRWFRNLSLPLELEAQADAWSTELAALVDGMHKTRSGAEVVRWELEQATAQLSLITQASQRLVYDARIVGSQDGHGWLWAWDNPSLDKAVQIEREPVVAGLQALAPELCQSAPCLTRQDAWALTGAAAAALGATGVYLASTEQTLIYVLLFGEPEPSLAELPEPETPSIFDYARSLLAPPTPPFADEVHREVQRLCNRGHAALRDSAVQPASLAKAIEELETARQLLAQQRWLYNTPPIGWLSVALGEAYLAAERYEDAVLYLEEAIELRATGLPALRALIRLAQGQLALGDRQAAVDALLRTYVMDGFETIAGEVGESELRQALAELRQSRAAILAQTSAPSIDGAPPEALGVVLALTQGLHELNQFAFEGSNAAEKQRQQAHVMCGADYQLERETTRRWCRLLATWCTPEKSSGLGGYGLDSPHDPAREGIEQVEHNGERLEVWTRSTPRISTFGDDIFVYVVVSRDGDYCVESAARVTHRGLANETRRSIL